MPHVPDLNGSYFFFSRSLQELGIYCVFATKIRVSFVFSWVIFQAKIWIALVFCFLPKLVNKRFRLCFVLRTHLYSLAFEPWCHCCFVFIPSLPAVCSTGPVSICGRSLRSPHGCVYPLVLLVATWFSMVDLHQIPYGCCLDLGASCSTCAITFAVSAPCAYHVLAVALVPFDVSGMRDLP